MPYAPIIGVLGYVLHPDGERALMVFRSRDGDLHQGKYNGLGGKLENDEDVIGCLHRELMEEAGITVTAERLRGTISWPGFNGRDVFGFVFLITGFRGTIPADNPEGTLGWHDVATMMDLPMWDGDRHFLPLVFDGSPPFHGVLPYDGGHSIGWRYVTAG